MTDDVTSDSSTGNDSTATADTSASAEHTPPSESTGQTTQPATETVTTTPAPARAPANGDGSLATDTRSATKTQPTQSQPRQTNGPPAQSAPNWEQRYQEQNRYLGRIAREAAELKKYKEQWGDLQPQQVRELVARQQQDAQRQQLKPWQPNHPEYANNSSRIARVETFQRSRQRILARQDLDPAQKQAEIGAAAEDNAVTAEDVALFRQYDQHRKDFTERLARDPESAIADIVERRVQSRLQEYDRSRQTSSATDAWMNDPKNAPLLEKHADDVLWALDQSTPRRDLGLTIAKQKAEIEALRARVGGQREVVEQAAAQQAATRKRSTVTRDAVTAAPLTDPVAEGMNQGLAGADLANFLRSKRRVADA